MVSCLQDFLNRKREEILYCIYIYINIHDSICFLKRRFCISDMDF